MLSVPPIDRLWHELHEMNPDFDSLGSKYSFLPSSAMPRSISLGGVIGCTSAQSSLVPCASAAVVVAAVSAAPMTASGIQRFCMFSLPVVMAARWYDALRRRFRVPGVGFPVSRTGSRAAQRRRTRRCQRRTDRRPPGAAHEEGSRAGPARGSAFVPAFLPQRERLLGNQCRPEIEALCLRAAAGAQE